MWKLEHEKGNMETGDRVKKNVKDKKLDVLFLVETDTKAVKIQRTIN